MPRVTAFRRDHTTSTYFSAEEYERVRTAAIKNQRTVADYMRTLVLNDVRRHEDADQTSAAAGNGQ